MFAISTKWDGAAVLLSAVCLVHCLLLPASMTLLPALGVTLLSHELFHELMLIVVLPTSLTAFFIGCHRHRRGSVAWLGGLGLALIVVAALAVGTVWGDAWERWLTIAGGLVLTAAHIQNFRLCRHRQCAEHDHPGVPPAETRR